MEPLFEIGIERSAKGSRQSAQTLYRQLKEAISDGRLAAGTKLPATRRSAAFFGVSRNTAVAVYEKLLSDGHVVARNGSGTYVAERPMAPPALRANSRAARLPDRRLNDFWLRPEVMVAMSFWRDPPVPPTRGRVNRQQSQPDLAESRFSSRGVDARLTRRVLTRAAASPDAPAIDFRPALVDSRLFPLDVYRRISAKRLRALEKKPARYKSPQGNQGNYTLRAAITRHIAVTRAVVCRPEDVLVTSGAQQAFDLLARALVTPSVTVVAVEDPGYPPMRVPFAAAGAKLVPVPVDNEGLVVERLPRNVGVICVCPSHQFPLGVTMSMQRRKALIEFARRTGAVIVEDDYDGEFRYEGSPLEALRTTEAADVVFYVGTFSKCMLPAMRLGFMAAPDWAMPTLIAAKNCVDWHCSIPVQLGVAGFIAEGHLARHVRKMRKIYKQRRDLLLSSLESELGDWLVPVSSLYGMHVAATARESMDLERLTDSLLRRDVKIHSLKRYFLGPQTRTGLVLGFGAVGLQGIERGIELLRRAYQSP